MLEEIFQKKKLCKVHVQLYRKSNNSFILKTLYVACCSIWYHLYNLKNVKNTHGVVLIFVKLQALACNFTKINTTPWVFFMFFKFYKWYQIAQRTIYELKLQQIKLLNHPKDV